MRRSLGAALACAALLVAMALGAVGVRVHQVRLAYRLDALRAERARLEQTIRQLEVEVATLRSPARVESRALQLGLIVPSADQVRLAHEYVAGGSGVAAARQARVEASVR